MIIHFIGNAGTGKTTLINMVAAEGGYVTPPRGLRRILSPADWMLPIAFPLVWSVGQRLSACNRKSNQAPGPWAWTAAVAMQKARQWALPSGQVCVIDHAMTNMLRKYTHENSGRLLDDLPLPNIVVNVSAPQAVRMARIVTRNKASHVASRYLTGESASEVGGMHARRWLALFGVEKAMHCLRAWSRWECRPELDDEELRSLIAHAQQTPLTEKDKAALRCEPLPESWRWLHDGCVDRGVYWLNVVNDGRNPAEVHASRIVEALCRWHA